MKTLISKEEGFTTTFFPNISSLLAVLRKTEISLTEIPFVISIPVFLF